MSKLDKLIKELCPDGVEYKKFKEFCEVGTGNSNRNEAIEDGKYLFFVRSKNVLKSNKYEFDEEAIIIPGEGGIGEIFHYVNGKYSLHQRAYRIKSLSNKMNTKFLYYYMFNEFKNYITKKAVSATVTSIRKPMIEEFPVPIPPIEVQNEIVNILDKFVKLEAELEAELEARRLQYEFYRGEMFELNKVEYYPIDEIAKCCAGGTPSTTNKEYWVDGTIPWMSSGEVNKGKVYDTDKKITQLGLDNSSAKMIPANTVVMALAGQGKTRGKVALTKIELCTNQSLAAIIVNDKINSDYYIITYKHNIRN
jgi:type I restriction enzyme S subunit